MTVRIVAMAAAMLQPACGSHEHYRANGLDVFLLDGDWPPKSEMMDALGVFRTMLAEGTGRSPVEIREAWHGCSVIWHNDRVGPYGTSITVMPACEMHIIRPTMDMMYRQGIGDTGLFHELGHVVYRGEHGMYDANHEDRLWWGLISEIGTEYRLKQWEWKCCPKQTHSEDESKGCGRECQLENKG